MASVNRVVNDALSSMQSTATRSSLMRWFLQTLAISQAVISTEWPAAHKLKDGEKFDFIVVGAGSSGAAVAARLSEVPHWQVLLIEAGGDPPPASVLPSMFATLAHTPTDWDYKASLDAGVGSSHPNRTIFMTRGKMLGGSSSNNYEIYARGVPADYDQWDQMAPGWNWDTVLHYFKKLERMTDPSVLKENHFLHSTEGPVAISRPAQNALFEAINERMLNSLDEIGVKRVLENYGPVILGASKPHFTFANGRRSSTAEAYLVPIQNRPNIHIAKFSRVIKVLVDLSTHHAYGVQVMTKSKRVYNIFANLEVVLSAGAIDSPKLLMLSGIGPKKELDKLDIEVISDLPVGMNLHDHMLTPIIFQGQSGFQTTVQNIATVTELDSYPTPIQVGLFKLNASSANYIMENKPQFQSFNIHMGAGLTPFINIGCVTVTNYDPSFCASIGNANIFNEIDYTNLVLLHPKSRGQVKLRSNNPLDSPVIELGYYRDKNDLDVMVEGIKYMTRLATTSYFRKVGGKVARLNVKECRGLKWGSDSYWRCYARNTVASLLHPVGTCAMGPDGVVDETLKVHGMSGLRVVDASVMPTIPSGNTNIPAIMVGERAADLIKADYQSMFMF
ncbi:ecdysone oxidase-like [Cydia amplana]|uniref:ecdysone oxidase-like n=1 Tax=Cydia amplana TaxID=1869771 RepID=UPI002FE57DDB